jgi:hypothetical protein
MTMEELRKAQQEQPFVPFAVHMANGRSFSVPHPDFFALHPNGRIVVVFEEGGGSHILDRTLMTEIEFKNNSSGAA